MFIKFAHLKPMLVLGAFLTLSCGWSPAPPASASPSPLPSPSPIPSGPPLPDVSGDWSGTLESASFSTRTILARFIQLADCIDGSWVTLDSGSRWVGAISVFARPGSLDGYMSFEFPGSGSKLCKGVGTLKGDATDDTATLTWNISSYDTDTCASSVPKQMILNLKHKK